eukprot:CAMPEP_0184857250 /NCGR_PEP_ID=MMETSP0580-20130426/2415_1 /TAXON_ID=1118495 /ORGANISM="Dactyliosolen fragilissimus" /LENGTH=168 /DNA_ID=CAMNT_0027352735 /DNA_START=31 /DNA_END=534 /DNA_ORIENTATION=-
MENNNNSHTQDSFCINDKQRLMKTKRRLRAWDASTSYMNAPSSGPPRSLSTLAKPTFKTSNDNTADSPFIMAYPLESDLICHNSPPSMLSSLSHIVSQSSDSEYDMEIEDGDENAEFSHERSFVDKELTSLRPPKRLRVSSIPMSSLGESPRRSSPYLVSLQHQDVNW